MSKKMNPNILTATLDYAFSEQTITGDTFLTAIYINASVTSKKAVMFLKAIHS